MHSRFFGLFFAIIFIAGISVGQSAQAEGRHGATQSAPKKAPSTKRSPLKGRAAAPEAPEAPGASAPPDFIPPPPPEATAEEKALKLPIGDSEDELAAWLISMGVESLEARSLLLKIRSTLTAYYGKSVDVKNPVERAGILSLGVQEAEAALKAALAAVKKPTLKPTLDLQRKWMRALARKYSPHSELRTAIAVKNSDSYGQHEDEKATTFGTFWGMGELQPETRTFLRSLLKQEFDRRGDERVRLVSGPGDRFDSLLIGIKNMDGVYTGLDLLIANPNEPKKAPVVEKEPYEIKVKP